MLAKFNPTGTHAHKGKLKVRVDLYPEPTDKTYALQYVDKPVRPYTEEELADEALQNLVPKVKELNPCLCHFITIDEDTNLISLANYVRDIFGKVTLSELDNILSAETTDLPRLSQVMRFKRRVGKVLPPKANTAEIKTKLNARFAGLEIRV